MAKHRKGMVIKNTNDRPVELELATRPLRLNPGEEQMITAREVRDPVLREYLQVRAINIVRPTTDDEEASLRKKLDDQKPEEDAEA